MSNHSLYSSRMQSWAKEASHTNVHNALVTTLRRCTGGQGTAVILPCEAHLGDAQGPHVLTVGRGAVSCSPGPSQEAANAFHTDPTVDSMLRWWWGTRQAGTGIVIPHGLQHGGDHPGKDAEYPSQADCWRSPLSCK